MNPNSRHLKKLRVQTTPEMNSNTNIISNKISSAHIVCSINDLLLEIFLRLPLKSLARFKLVSKNWNSIISDTGFSILRNPHPNPAVGIIFETPSSKLPYAHVLSFDKSTNPQIRTLDFPNPNPNPNPNPCAILNSCNGLLLCSSTTDFSTTRDYPVRYYVYNPTTNNYFGLPQTDERVDWPNLCQTTLAFDPSKSPHFKVVCARKLAQISNNHEYQLEVYSSETGCWRKFSRPLSGHVNFRYGVYWNGAIHWISFFQSRKSLYINPYDDDDQMPHEMPTPPKRGFAPYYFGESCGHLHYIEECMVRKEFNVYEMSLDYSNWFVKYKVDAHAVSYDFMICTLVRGKKDEDAFFVFRFQGKLSRYNLVDRTFETICELNVSHYDHCLQYIESLCSV